jgi:hypothetical protein
MLETKNTSTLRDLNVFKPMEFAEDAGEAWGSNFQPAGAHLDFPRHSIGALNEGYEGK